MKNLLMTLLLITVADAREPDSTSFFPSSVGNVWVYSSQSGTYRTEIEKDSIDQYGNRFLFYPSTLEQSRRRFRIDTLLQVFYIPFGLNWLYYKLDADSGETWTVRTDAPRTLARVDNIYQSLIFGKERTVKEIAYYRLQPGDTVINENAVYERYILLASGIGELYEYQVENGPVKTLLGCVIDGDTMGTITAVIEKPKEVITDFNLHQNYPNPFNPSTTITYDLKTNGKVTLKVHNILGREVATLVNGYQTQGNYKINFDARNLAGGVYIYTLYVGKTNFSKIMLCLK